METEISKIAFELVDPLSNSGPILLAGYRLRWQREEEEEEKKKKKQEEQQKEEEEKKYCNRRGVLPFTIFKHDSICHFWEIKEIDGIVKYCNRRGFLYAF
uniref:Uncharacterized protein n=1 Tax=Solanum tuberosum TaxID=4113 RepID=M1DEU3_SOLTU